MSYCASKSGGEAGSSELRAKNCECAVSYYEVIVVEQPVAADNLKLPSRRLLRIVRNC